MSKGLLDEIIVDLVAYFTHILAGTLMLLFELTSLYA